MIIVMPQPLAYITGPRSSFEEQVKHLRIPKARQKELLKMMEETRQRLAAEDKALRGGLSKSDEAQSEGKAEIVGANR
jgi:ribosomal 50S subunit-associated protein YjgA (DUF615 family)